MAKLSILAGTTSKLVDVFVLDSSSTTGAGLTGLVYNSGSLTGYYYREGAGSAVAITLATMTLGTWATGGFVVVDGTNMPGVYQLSLPNAAIAAGAKSVVVMLKGATNMAPVLLEIELTAVDNQDSVRFGLSALPNGAMILKKNQAFTAFPFLLLQTDGVTPKTGATVTAQRLIDGGSFGSCANSVTEVANGIYIITLAAGDTNGNAITLMFSASGALTRTITLFTQP